MDPLTKIQDYGYRHYSLQNKRWMTVDPIRDGSNWYVYCSNDPINFIDPLGLCAESDKSIYTNSTTMFGIVPKEASPIVVEGIGVTVTTSVIVYPGENTAEVEVISTNSIFETFDVSTATSVTVTYNGYLYSESSLTLDPDSAYLTTVTNSVIADGTVELLPLISTENAVVSTMTTFIVDTGDGAFALTPVIVEVELSDKNKK
jgi:hypothetical protein